MVCGQLEESDIQWWIKNQLWPTEDVGTFVWCRSTDTYKNDYLKKQVIDDMGLRVI